jgi:hypothetical protein
MRCEGVPLFPGSGHKATYNIRAINDANKNRTMQPGNACSCNTGTVDLFSETMEEKVCDDVI